MKLFVTGATGFIGSHFVRGAHRAGYEVIALRRSPAARPRIEFEKEPHWVSSSLAAVPVGELVGVDAVVHLAAAGVTDRAQNWDECFQVNVGDSLKLWRTAVAAGVRRFVICGSCFEYGRVAERHQFIPTDAPLEPTHAYAASKAAASMAAIAMATQSNLAMIIARPFHVYGEGESDHRLWPSLRRAAKAGEDFALTPGEQVRDFVPVEQVAASLVAACADMAVQPGVARIINIGTGRPQTVRQFAESRWQEWGATGQLRFGEHPYRDGEVMRYVPLVESTPIASLNI